MRKSIARYSAGAASAFIIAHASAGFAQVATPPADGAAATPPALPAARGEGLEEIIVTAERRAANVQNVPIAVTAITASALENAGVGNTADLGSVVPSLTISVAAGSPTATPTLRGVGNENGGVGDESVVAVYIDGAYIASPQATYFELNNIQQLEVLRGPQGTLFGRNAVGGVVQIITRTPQQTPEGFASVGYANYDTFAANGYLTGGLTSNIAADLSLNYVNQADGFGRNTTLNTDAFTSRSFVARSKILWDLDDTTFTLAGDYSSTRDQSFQYRTFPGEKSGADGKVHYNGFYNADWNIDPFSKIEQWGVSLTAQHEFGGAEVVSISSYRDLELDKLIDSDGSSAAFLQVRGPQTERTFTQELQLKSTNGERLDWIVGAFYLHDHTFLHGYIQTLPNGGQRTNPADQVTNSYAVFGQATYKLFERTSLTAGLRYSIDSRRMSGGSYNIVNGAFIPVSPLYPAFPPGIEDSQTYKEPTWRLAIDHRFSDDVLAYLSYNRGYKSGVYNSVPVPAPLVPVRPEILDAYEVGLKTDLLDRKLRINVAAYWYEFKDLQLQQAQANPTAGNAIYNAAKARIRGLELDIDARPVPELTISGAVALTDSRYLEFPGAAIFFPCPTPVPASGPAATCPQPGGAGYYGPPGGTAINLPEYDATGRRLNKTPVFAGNINIRYDIPTDSGTFSLAAGDAYKGKFYWDPGNVLAQKPVHLVSASVAWTSLDSRYRLRLWAENLANERYYLGAKTIAFGNLGVPAAPRTYGVTASVKFGG